MKYSKLFIIPCLILMTSDLMAQKTVPIQLKTKIDTISYLLGFSNGNGLMSEGFSEINLAVFQEALTRGLEDEEPQIDLRQASDVTRNYLMQKKELLAENNLKQANAFLLKNGKQPHIKSTASGLQYEVLFEGEGPKPSGTDQVSVLYKGTTLDGTIFDQTQGRETRTFGVNQVIKGWTEGLQLMPVGSKYRLYIPPNLAYGNNQRGADIQPNSLLIFDVELVGIK